jgi:N-acetylglucosamine-6-sulfatase
MALLCCTTTPPFRCTTRLLLAAATFAAAAARAAPQPPNLILLLLDDQDSMLGSGLDVMPHYRRRFVEEGAAFGNAFVSAPKCCPSRTSMLSGRMPHRLNETALGWCGDFMAQARYDSTFVAPIKARGYATALVGKYTNVMGPLCPKQGTGTVPRGFSPADGDLFFAMCNEAFYNITWTDNGQLTTTGDSPADYEQAVIGNRTLPWLAAAARASAAPGGKPFFAYLAPHAPHLPATPAPWHLGTPLPSQTAPRPPSFDAFSEGKSWNVAQDGLTPFSPTTTSGIDLHFRNRQRALLSVDDYVRDIFGALEAAGVLNNTFVVATSDHGYHLGEFGLPFEKSTPYDTDVRVPFYVRGPGVAPGSVVRSMVSLMDVGATLLELAGATQPGERTTDGRSLVPLLAGGDAGAPPGWREGGLLVEHLGEVNQWMQVCGTIFNASCPGVAEDPFYLIDGPQNTWAMLRVVNDTHDISYCEFRPQTMPPVRSATNWTEAYNNSADPWQSTNIVELLPPAVRAELADRLWAVADCAGDSCP